MINRLVLCANDETFESKCPAAVPQNLLLDKESKSVSRLFLSGCFLFIPFDDIRKVGQVMLK